MPTPFSMTPDELLADEARSMGRPCVMLDGAELIGGATVVTYTIDSDTEAGLMRQVRLAVANPSQKLTSLILDTSWPERDQ